MRVANVVLALVVLGLSYVVRADLSLMVALIVTALLTLLTALPIERGFLIKGFAVLNTVLMFYYFYRFFTVVPTLELHWFTQVQYANIWIVLVGGFVSMHVLADNSCCLKRDLEEPKLFSWSQIRANLTERHA